MAGSRPLLLAALPALLASAAGAAAVPLDPRRRARGRAADGAPRGVPMDGGIPIFVQGRPLRRQTLQGWVRA